MGSGYHDNSRVSYINFTLIGVYSGYTWFYRAAETEGLERALTPPPPPPISSKKFLLDLARFENFSG